jgi:hypothetical protein
MNKVTIVKKQVQSVSVAGMRIYVDIFALQGNPDALRIPKPGTILGESAKPLTK